MFVQVFTIKTIFLSLGHQSLFPSTVTLKTPIPFCARGHLYSTTATHDDDDDDTLFANENICDTFDRSPYPPPGPVPMPLNITHTYPTTQGNELYFEKLKDGVKNCTESQKNSVVGAQLQYEGTKVPTLREYTVIGYLSSSIEPIWAKKPQLTEMGLFGSAQYKSID